MTDGGETPNISLQRPRNRGAALAVASRWA
jgi:hypothetical protein